MEHVSILCSRRARSLHTPNDASQRKLNDVSTAALMAAWPQSSRRDGRTSGSGMRLERSSHSGPMYRDPLRRHELQSTSSRAPPGEADLYYLQRGNNCVCSF
jgi:hypothetical protein